MMATENSIDNPILGGIATLKRIITEPTTPIVSVCPTPQSAPIIAASRILRCWLTMVVTATT